MLYKINREILKDNHKEILLLLETVENDKEYCQKKIDELIKFVDSNDTYLFGHIENNKLVSFLWCYKRNYNNTERLHISFLAVNCDFQRQGLAKELLNKVIEILKSTDIEIIDLNVSSNNKAAIKLYEKLGFIEESRLLKFRKD
ncbi:GNAT family N-acetyltransferase [Macrococcoides canis]|uniref:GNAT family N-acetyltransferase n=1 Tax=Macrococcoides canis TaxID=1855823 RepID=UPI001AEC6784|nr:GNAT family N-acetyltransferase [Macrococcus canis]QTQ08966.1 GNAT family N-acetyltransferase [Macrococcus canis]